MKKLVCAMLSLVMVFAFTAIPAFAADGEELLYKVSSTTSVTQPCGAIWGNGSTNIKSGVTRGEFSFNVSGIMNWSTAQIMLSISGFNDGDYIDARVYRPDGTECFQVSSWLGDVLSPDNRTDTGWIKISNGQKGTYKVVYTVGNWYGNTTGSGTLFCSIK